MEVHICLDLTEIQLQHRVCNIKALVLPSLAYDVIIGLQDMLHYGLLRAMEDVLLQRRKTTTGLNAVSLHRHGDDAVAMAATDDLGVDVTVPLVSGEVADPITDAVVGGPDSLRQAIRQLLEEFAHIFATEVSQNPARVRPMSLYMLDGAQYPLSMRARTRVQCAEHEKEIRRQVEALVHLGVLESCESEFYSQVLLVKKADGSLRFCIDYRHLNKITYGLSWPLPKIAELIPGLGKQCYYSVMDLTAGYHQVPLTKEASKFTAFRISTGIFRFTRVPFGLQGAPSHFQRVMTDEVLRGLIPDVAHVYIDDVIVKGRSEEEHLKNLREVFKRFHHFNIKVKLKKCRFGVPQVNYVGHLITEAGYEMAPERKEALLKIPPPRSVKEVQSFLGVVNFMRAHIKGFAQLAGPLYDMTKTRSKKSFQLSVEALNSFQSLRQAAFDAPLLHFLEPTGDILLYTDASDIALGAHLTQLIGDKEQSVLFLSKTFTAVQRRWSVTEREMFAVFYAVTHLKFYLGARKFTVKTDHNSLKYWLSESASPKVHRWRIALLEYDMMVEHIPGEDNVVADVLSRLPEPVSLATMDKMSKNNSHASETQQVISTLLPPPPKTEEERMEIFRRAHGGFEGHSGTQQTMDQLHRQGYEWPSMRVQLAEFIRSCPICQKSRIAPVAAHGGSFSLRGRRPREKVAVDTLGPLTMDDAGYQYILVVIDTFSKFVVLRAARSKGMDECAEILAGVFHEYGEPELLISDGGTQFVNAVVKTMCDERLIERKISTAYSHEENGYVERYIREVRRHLSSLIADLAVPKKWSSYVPAVQRIINTRVCRMSGFSPAELETGRSHALDSNRFESSKRFKDLTQVTTPLEWFIKAQRFREDAEFKTCQVIEAAADRKTSTSATITFNPGDLVLLERVERRKDAVIEFRREGPLRVIGQDGNSVEVVSLSDPNKVQKVHVSRCRRYVVRDGSDALQESLRGREAYIVESIVSHHYVPESSKAKRNLHVEVLWKGYSETSIEPVYPDIIKTEAFTRYILGQHGSLRNQFQELIRLSADVGTRSTDLIPDPQVEFESSAHETITTSSSSPRPGTHPTPSQPAAHISSTMQSGIPSRHYRDHKRPARYL